MGDVWAEMDVKDSCANPAVTTAAGEVEDVSSPAVIIAFIGVFGGFIFGCLAVFFCIYRRAKGDAEVLKNLKIKLEKKKRELRQLLEKVESEREKNKDDLQSMEKQITQNETSDATETLLKTKEDLLKSGWKLQEKKTIYEKQLTDIENCLRSFEI